LTDYPNEIDVNLTLQCRRLPSTQRFDVVGRTVAEPAVELGGIL
jgi:hypothetical protein